MTGAGRRRRRRTHGVLITVATVLAVGAAAAAASGFGVDRWRGGNAGDAGSDLPATTARVTRQTLVDTQAETGELRYGDPTTVTCRIAGTLTALPATGTTVSRGQALFRVDDTPVVLLYGALPAYRTLAPGMEGADVKQFEQNLRALGYRGFTVDDEYTAGTASAVKEWQEGLGLPETGVVAHGRVVYAPAPVRIESHKANVGDAAQPGGEGVLTYTGTTRMVTVALDMADQRLARKGGAVAVTLPDGRSVPGKITAVETVVDSAEGGGNQEPTTKLALTVAVADAKALAGLDQASVTVVFTAAERKNVLTVPVAALLALAEGGYGVQVVADGTARIVAVETGLFAGGRVEVSGGGLTEGMTVGMPS